VSSFYFHFLTSFYHFKFRIYFGWYLQGLVCFEASMYDKITMFELTMATPTLTHFVQDNSDRRSEKSDWLNVHTNT